MQDYNKGIAGPAGLGCQDLRSAAMESLGRGYCPLRTLTINKIVLNLTIAFSPIQEPRVPIASYLPIQVSSPVRSALRLGVKSP